MSHIAHGKGTLRKACDRSRSRFEEESAFGFGSRRHMSQRLVSRLRTRIFYSPPSTLAAWTHALSATEPFRAPVARCGRLGQLSNSQVSQMTPTVPRTPKYRVSGHETFPCRYTWLPKVVQSLSENSKLFRDEDEAMVRLGVGKNMVRAIRFWADATGVSCDDGEGNFKVSSIGSQLLGNSWIRSVSRRREDIVAAPLEACYKR